MKHRFLRRPTTTGEVVADIVRVMGLASIAVAALWWTPMDAGILALALPALLLPRFVGVHPGFDVAYGVVVLVAAWSNVLELYRLVPGWDLVAHFAATGLLAAMGLVLCMRLGIVPDPDRAGSARRASPIVLTTVMGLALSAVWEMIEWAGYTFVTQDIFVTYTDTIGDMAVGGLGAALAGVGLACFPRLTRDPSGGQDAGAARPVSGGRSRSRLSSRAG